MPYSYISYAAPGGQSEFQIPFPYLNVSTLYVRVSGVIQTQGISYTVDTTTNKVHFLEGHVPAAGVTVLLRRITPRTVGERVVVFTDPSDLGAEVLNDSNLQLLYIIQEALDDIANGIGVGGQPGGPLIGGITLETQDALDALHHENDETTATLQAAITSLNASIAEANAELDAAFAEVDAARAEAAAALASLSLTVSGVSSTASGAAAAVTTEIGARAAADVAIGARIDTVEVNVGSVAASVTTESVARANAISALASQLNTVQSTANGAAASVTSEAITRAAADVALGSRIDTVQADLGSTNASVTAESVARAGADTALGARIDSVQAATSAAAASVTSESIARANADTALGARIDTIQADNANAAALVTAEAAARVTADNAIAASVTATTASLNTFKASTNSALASLATADSALSGLITTVQAQNATIAASVTTEQTTRVTALNEIYGRWGVHIDDNGRVIGRIRLDGTNGTSALDFTSDSLRVSHPSAPGVSFRTVNRVSAVTDWRTWGAATGFSFTHGTSAVLVCPAQASAPYVPQAIVNVREGSINVLVLSRILGQDGLHTVYWRKNGTGSFYALGAVYSDSGAVMSFARGNDIWSGVSPTDYFEFFAAPCDGNGTIPGPTPSLRVEIDVLAFNW